MKNKKIVIIPTFNDAHFIKFQIPNIIDTINPDYIIYNEGMFPGGPEGTTIENDKFLSNFTLDGKRGFDFNELKVIINDAQVKYLNTKIILNEMNYIKGLSPTSYYIQGCSNFEELGIKLEVGDYIFPYEGDVFHHEDSKDEIVGYCNQLEPNQGFRSVWLDFQETQYYVEKRLYLAYKNDTESTSRKICIKFGDMNWYSNVLSNLLTQQYFMLFPTDLVTFHYSGWKPGKYKEFRFGDTPQLNREHMPGYLQDMLKGYDEIRKNRNDVIEDVVIRPNGSGNGRYACYIDIEHPKHIREHPCYIKDN